MRKDTAYFKIRFTPELKEWLQNEADKNYRSMTAQINKILVEQKDKQEKQNDQQDQ